MYTYNKYMMSPGMKGIRMKYERILLNADVHAVARSGKRAFIDGRKKKGRKKVTKATESQSRVLKILVSENRPCFGN